MEGTNSYGSRTECAVHQKFSNVWWQPAGIIEGIEGSCNYSDDILVWGNTQKEHDVRLRMVLQRIAETGLKLNREKYKEAQTELRYITLTLSVPGWDCCEMILALLSSMFSYQHSITSPFTLTRHHLSNN